MKVQLLAITPTPKSTRLNITLLIGGERHKFTLAIELIKINGEEREIIKGDEIFEKVFLFNAKIATKIAQLVAKSVRQENVNLPMFLGELNLVESNILNYGSDSHWTLTVGASN